MGSRWRTSTATATSTSRRPIPTMGRLACCWARHRHRRTSVRLRRRLLPRVGGCGRRGWRRRHRPGDGEPIRQQRQRAAGQRRWRLRGRPELRHRHRARSPLCFSDFNNDGKLDIATANYASNNVTVLLGRGNGTFSPPLNSRHWLGSSAVAAGDFNGDGWLDAATANYSGNNVSVLINDRSGRRRMPRPSPSTT